MDELFEGKTTALEALVLRSRPQAMASLTRVGDEVVRELVGRQVAAGLDVITDGEVRRPSFWHALYDSVEGFDEAPRVGDDANGDIAWDPGAWRSKRYAEPVVSGRIRKASSPAARDATFLRAITDFPFKVTLAAPSMAYMDFVQLGDVYGSRDEFADDVVEVTKSIVAEVVAAGARWVQFDFPLYPALFATANGYSYLEEARAAGDTDETLLDKGLAADRAVTEAIPDDVTVGLHLCRGNFSGGFWSGTLEPMAERLFTELPHDRFLVEWEDIAREGGYAPIRHVPKGHIVAMGMVSTKTPQLESEDDLLHRIEDAAKYIDIDQLAITSQCGFASMYIDQLVEAEEAQWRKLDLLGRVAERVWGR